MRNLLFNLYELKFVMVRILSNYISNVIIVIHESDML